MVHYGPPCFGGRRRRPGLFTRLGIDSWLTPRLSLYADFWGPVSNFGIPMAAVLDTQKSPEL